MPVRLIWLLVFGIKFKKGRLVVCAHGHKIQKAVVCIGALVAQWHEKHWEVSAVSELFVSRSSLHRAAYA